MKQSFDEVKTEHLDNGLSGGYVTICPRCHDSLVLSEFGLQDYLETNEAEQREREIQGSNIVQRANELRNIVEFCGVSIEGRIRHMRDSDNGFLLCGECAEKVKINEYHESIELWPLEQGSS